MGLLIPCFLTASIAELQNATRPDDTRGLIAASLLVLVSMLLLRLQIGKREKEQE